ncbi:MAG: mevalonate kinase [Candidatus Sericytochromatia bacterium]|nr:mevalonate kinase [Candidatus Sericytochromatia bacterium]
MALTDPRPALGRAPGKLILVGEHAVVHGRPAVAVPFPPVGVVAEAIPVPGAVRVTSERSVGSLDALARTVEGALVAVGAVPANLSVHVQSTIPVGAGLGSSAATAVAVVRAAAGAFGQTLTPRLLRGLAHIAERAAHGRPSGLDVAAVLADGPIRFLLGEEATPLASGFRPCWVVADSGRPRDTRSAVAAVSAWLSGAGEAGRDVLDGLAREADVAERALRDGDSPGLGASLDRAHGALQALGVSDDGLDALVATARGAGALGAKLTGAGRGGCVVALAPDVRTAEAIAAAWRRGGVAGVYGEGARG